MNGAIQELNAGAVDSAETHAKWSLYFNDTAPYGYMVLAQVAQRRQQTDSAIALFQKTIALASTDSTYNNVKWQSELNLGQLASNAAQAATDSATKQRYDGVAKATFEALANDTTASNSYRESARSSMVQVSLEMGDTATAKAAYQAQLSDPSKFTFNELIQAGVAGRMPMTRRQRARSSTPPTPRIRTTATRCRTWRSTISGRSSTIGAGAGEPLKEVDPDGNNARLATLTYAGLAKKFADLNKDIVARYAKAKGAKLKKHSPIRPRSPPTRTACIRISR